MNNNTKETLIQFFKSTWIYFSSAFVVLIGGFVIVEMLFPVKNNFNYTWEGILMFMCICAGLGWIIHGTGFLLVKVSK